MYDIYATNRANPQNTWHLDNTQLISASMTLSISGVHTATIETCEWMPYGTRICIRNNYEFVIIGIETTYTERKHPNNIGKPVNRYSCVSAMWYDLSTTINNAISGTYNRFTDVLRQVFANTAYFIDGSKFVGFVHQGLGVTADLKPGTVWEQFNKVISSLTPADANTTHLSIGCNVDINYKFQIDRRIPYAIAQAYPTSYDISLDTRSTDIANIRRTLSDTSVYDAVVVADKNGMLYQNGRVYPGPTQRANSILCTELDGTTTRYKPTKIITNSDFDFSQSTAGVDDWISSVLKEKTDVDAVYEIEFLEGSYLGGRPVLGSYVNVTDSIMPSPFAISSSTTTTTYVVNELKVDLITEKRTATLGKLSKYTPVIKRTEQ